MATETETGRMAFPPEPWWRESDDRDRITVTESGRVAVISTYHGPTNSSGSRITVRRADGGGKRLTVGWDYSLGSIENHAAAIRQYLDMMEWGGSWNVGATRTGAVATWAGWVTDGGQS